MNNLPDTPNGWDQYRRLLNNLPQVVPPSDMGGRITTAVEGSTGKGRGIFGISWMGASGIAAALLTVALCFYFFSGTETNTVVPVKGTATVERAAKKSARSNRGGLPADTALSPFEVPAVQIPNPPDNLGYPADTFTLPVPAKQHQPTTGPGRGR